MGVLLDLRACQLLAARLCHDFAGPIAAISNGAELLADDDPDFVREASGLIADSARIAARRLQVFRFVYGFSQGAMAGPPPHTLVGDYFADSAVICDYVAEAREWSLERQRLAVLLLVIGADAMPRGGRLALEPEGEGLAVVGSGEGAAPSDDLVAALDPSAPVEALTSRTVGAHIAVKLAEGLGWRLAATREPGRFRLFTQSL